MHLFIFKSGLWKGSGTLSFSAFQDRLPFEMSWRVLPESEGVFRFSQKIEVESFGEPLYNYFNLTLKTQNTFTILLENPTIGKAKGEGLFDDHLISWEFKEEGYPFQGYEIYELQPNGLYKMRAEFLSGEDDRTFVEGVIEKI